MSYFSLLAEQTGLADRRPGSGQRGRPSPTSVTALEIDEVREVPQALSPQSAAEELPRPSSAPPAAPTRPLATAGDVSPWSALASPPDAAPAHLEAGRPEVAGKLQPRPEVVMPGATDERPAEIPSRNHTAAAQRRPSARTAPIETTEEQSAEPASPRPAHARAPETYLPGQRVLETVAALRAWAAAAPTGAVENPIPPNDLTAPPATDAAVPATPGGERGWRPSPAEPPAGPAFEPPSEVQNMTLSIGAIELTVEAPQQPAAPAPRSPRAADAPAEGPSRLLRRHYVNWLGGP